MARPKVIDPGDFRDIYIRKNACKMTLREMSNALGVSFYTVQNFVKSNNLKTRYEIKRKWSDEEKEIASKMYLDGETYETIAKKIGRTFVAVNLQLRNLGCNIAARKEKHTVPQEWVNLISGRKYDLSCQWENGNGRSSLTKKMIYIGISGGKHLFKCINGGWVTSLTNYEIGEQIKESKNEM